MELQLHAGLSWLLQNTEETSPHIPTPPSPPPPPPPRALPHFPGKIVLYVHTYVTHDQEKGGPQLDRHQLCAQVAKGGENRELIKNK